MQDLPAVLGALGVFWLAMVSPGPNFVLITHTAMLASRVNGLAAAWGVAIGGGIWTIATLVGLGTFLQLFPLAASLLQVAGGLYLIHLGIRSWRKASEPLALQRGELPVTSFGRTLVRGILTSLSNPKSAAFYGSVFTLFATPSMALSGTVLLVVGIVSSSFLWHSCLALWFSNASVRQLYKRAKTPIDRAIGIVMAGLGVRLLVGRA